MIADETEQALAVARRAVGGTPPPDGQSPDGLAIDHVVLVGGSTRVPLIERRLRELFPVDFTRAPEDAIARGAALHGAQLGADDWQKREDVVESVAPPLEREPRRPRAAPRPAELRAAASGWVAMFSPALAGAESLWQSGQQAEAIAEMERALEEMRKYIGFLCFQLSAQAHRAAAQTIDDGNFNEAAPYIDQAIAAAEKGQQYGNTNKDAVAIHHHSLNLKGHLLLAAGKLEEAHSVVQKAIRMVPRCAGCEQLRERIEQAMRQGRTAPGTPGWRRKRRR
jgi:tetratricopeptide (TPR) repeat protein